MKIYRTINRKTLPLLTLGLVLTSIFIPILSPRVSAVFVKGNGEAIYHATLNPDVPNVIVEAVRQAPYAGQANTYTLHMTGSTYSSDSSGNNVIKVPSSCNTSSDFNMAKFIIRVSISNGGTLINGTTTVIGQSSGVGKCGGDEYNVNVAVKDTSSISTVGSICGVLSYVDPSSGKTKPYQPNSTVKLSGASTATTNTDANGSYCFYSLSAGNYNIDAAYAYQDANGLPAQAKFTKKNIALATSQNLVINDTFDLVGLNKTAATPKDPGTTPTCESTGLSLAWIVCPFVNGLADAIDGIYGGFIKPLLITKPIDVSGTKKCQSSDSFKGCDYMIWSEFRVYGNILLIIALLVIVFGQSIGGGLVDAYTAKKVLPRLLAASILINLSIYIVAFMVDITNIIGGGIQSLLTLPFTDHSAFHLTLNGGAAGTLATLGLGALLGAAGSIWLAITEPGILLSIAGPLVSFLALFILLPGILIFVAILGTVIIRRGLIIFLILISPVAFALYCLPNTEKYFKKWWELLLKTLLVYPIIALVFTISDIFAVTISQGGNTSGLVSWAAQLISVAALILPLFLIPFSFKLAGGFIGRLHDLAGGMRKRGQEMIKGNANDPNSLRNKTKRNLLSAAANNDLSGKALLTRANPTTLIGSRRGLRKARLGATKNMYQGVYGKQGSSAAMYEYNQQDSNIMGDLAKHATGKASRAAIDKEIDAGTLVRGSANHAQRLFSSAAADKIGRTPDMRRAAVLNPATIGYEFDDGEVGWNDATRLMREISGARQDPVTKQWSGGDEGTYRSMVNTFQYVAKSSAGRVDLAGATDGKPYNFKKAWGSGTLSAIGSGKDRAVRSAGRDFLAQFETAKIATAVPGDVDGQIQIEDSVAEAGRFYKEQQTIAQYATGAVRDEAVRQMALFEDAGIVGALAKPLMSGRLSPDGAPMLVNDLAKKGLRGYENPSQIQQNQQQTP